MAKYEIHGGKPLNGTVVISGAKNAAVAILPAALLVSGKCRIENVPDISDVRILMSILQRMGAKITSPERNVVEIDCSKVTCTEPDADLVKKMRASYYIMGALLSPYNDETSPWYADSHDTFQNRVAPGCQLVVSRSAP